MDLDTERMYYAGYRRPEKGQGFGSIFEDGFYLNYLHGLDFLCRKHLNSESRVLELGSFYGASGELFTRYCNNVTCVDLQLYPEMQEVINRCGIRFYKSESTKFLSEVTKGDYDLIYIDTSHDFDQTKSEVSLAYNLLNEGQVVAGHDYNSPGVHNAILDVFEYPDIELYLDSSWAIKCSSNITLK